MSDKTLWRNTNIEEIRKRTLKRYNLSYGMIIVLDKNKEINLMLRNGNKSYTIIRNLINYESLRNAGTIDKRISIVLDAVRGFNFYFCFEKEVTNLIING